MTSATPTPSDTGSRGRPRDEERTMAILEATRSLLHQQGWDELRMGDVAKAAGCGLATIYRRWETKEELVAAAMRARPLPDVELTGDAETDLRALLHGFAAEVQDTGEAMFGFLAATRTDPLLREAMDESFLGTARPMLRSFTVELMGETRHVDTVVDATMGLLLVRDGLLGGTTPDRYADDVISLIHALAER